MGKQWLTLIGLGVALSVAVIAWDLFLTFSDFKGGFEYVLVPIEPGLYSTGLQQHLRDDAKFAAYEAEAQTTTGIDQFK